MSHSHRIKGETADEREEVFCLREDLLLVWIFTFISFMIFY